ncbi:duf1741 domain containing protein [Grosmannia clavigera kw1407]|uniref:Duf1741 domain containing protein n=1 Tax=Grosmannia clavigera (strain kw1407 / UAMH 11150) TaxID=655863 RepID=F0X7W0_GROCL|nr:duf1741 domain containing protein [Grosmannia clavigera kw1407]EFX06266.1 duf1741 domain containing protein [Grosmannia clavigera kw1407]
MLVSRWVIPRPEVFKPKIVQLYDELFSDEDFLVASDGFWTEFFLLRPDRSALRHRIEALSPPQLLVVESQTRALFSRAIAVAAGGVIDKGPDRTSTERRPVRSETAAAAALDTLTTFLSAVLAKKYTNPSSDVIAVLAGLDNVDTVMTEFVSVLDGLLRHGRTPSLRAKVVDVALATAAGAYQTTLLTYFIHRDLFPSIIRTIIDTDASNQIFESFVLLGLLANYNKFEFRNPYQLRLADFVNEEAIQTILHSVGEGCQRLRNQYVVIQDDAPEGWTLANTLGLIGLSAIAPGTHAPPKPVYDAETASRMFAALPGDEAAVLLATYDFTHANKLFCSSLVTSLGASVGASSPRSAGGEAEHPIASFISLASYLLQHAFCSQRTTLYAHVGLMVFRLLIEDVALCKRMCSDESRVSVRLCRQRLPHLPLVKQPRPLAASVMDAMVDSITHNLQRRLDIGLYTSCVGILLRLVAHLSRTRTRLAYHWAELFRALISLVRFLTTYAADLQGLPHLETLIDHVVSLMALALSAGESFLPTPAAYDDLFYKVVEAGEVLVKFRDIYKLASRPASSIETLVSAKEGLDSWEKYREADERTLLKKVARIAVADVKSLLEGRE